MIHKIEMTQSEIQDYIQSLRRNALQCMNILIEQVQAYELEFTSDESKVIKKRKIYIGLTYLIYIYI